jgi:hypothetical protein
MNRFPEIHCVLCSKKTYGHYTRVWKIGAYIEYWYNLSMSGQGPLRVSKTELTKMIVSRIKDIEAEVDGHIAEHEDEERNLCRFYEHMHGGHSSRDLFPSIVRQYRDHDNGDIQSWYEDLQTYYGLVAEFEVHSAIARMENAGRIFIFDRNTNFPVVEQ